MKLMLPDKVLTLMRRRGTKINFHVNFLSVLRIPFNLIPAAKSKIQDVSLKNITYN